MRLCLILKKDDLTPEETKAAIDGFKLHDELCCRIEDCEMDERDMKNGYSGHDVPDRQYHITSYGMPDRAMSERSYGSMSHGDRMMDYSGAPHYGVHGWYQNDKPMMNNNMRSYNNPDYSDRSYGYSRHSVSDRVVSMVEKMMDSVESDYERQELQKYIRTIRAMGLSE